MKVLLLVLGLGVSVWFQGSVLVLGFGLEGFMNAASCFRLLWSTVIAYGVHTKCRFLKSVKMQVGLHFILLDKLF